jgi:hypothetical protein
MIQAWVRGRLGWRPLSIQMSDVRSWPTAGRAEGQPGCPLLGVIQDIASPSRSSRHNHVTTAAGSAQTTDRPASSTSPRPGTGDDQTPGARPQEGRTARSQRRKSRVLQSHFWGTCAWSFGETGLSKADKPQFAGRRCSLGNVNRVDRLRYGRRRLQHRHRPRTDILRRSYGTALHLTNTRNEKARQSFSAFWDDFSGHRRRVRVRLAELLAAPQRYQRER